MIKGKKLSVECDLFLPDHIPAQTAGLETVPLQSTERKALHGL